MLTSEHLGLVINSPKSVSVYTDMGGALVRKTTPNGFIGKLNNWNSKQTWLRLNDTTWILNDSSYTFTPHYTQFQLDDRADNVSDLARKKSEQAAKEVEQVASEKSFLPESLTLGISDIGSKLKWILLITFVVVLVALFYRIKG